MMCKLQSLHHMHESPLLAPLTSTQHLDSCCMQSPYTSLHGMHLQPGA